MIWFSAGRSQDDGADMGPIRHVPVAAVQPGAGLVPAVAVMQGARQRNGSQDSKSNAQPFVSSVVTHTRLPDVSRSVAAICRGQQQQEVRVPQRHAAHLHRWSASLRHHPHEGHVRRPP